MEIYQHILDNKPYRKNLKFVAEIDPNNRIFHNPTLFPQDWENIRHIVGDLYYAWDHDPLLGCVYLCSWDNK